MDLSWLWVLWWKNFFFGGRSGGQRAPQWPEGILRHKPLSGGLFLVDAVQDHPPHPDMLRELWASKVSMWSPGNFTARKYLGYWPENCLPLPQAVFNICTQLFLWGVCVCVCVCVWFCLQAGHPDNGCAVERSLWEQRAGDARGRGSDQGSCRRLGEKRWVLERRMETRRKAGRKDVKQVVLTEHGDQKGR